MAGKSAETMNIDQNFTHTKNMNRTSKWSALGDSLEKCIYWLSLDCMEGVAELEI